MKVEHGIVLDDGSTIELNIGNNYNLDFAESINPGPPSQGQDYNNLRNKPQINSTTLQGNISLQQLGLRSILYGTTQEWNSQQDLISTEGTIYIYSDYQTITIDGVEKTIPGIKIGDGKTYLMDMPFITQAEPALIRYTGDYTVIPKADKAQILPTKDLLMTDDLTVTKVPYYETSNNFSGKTVFIAEDVTND